MADKKSSNEEPRVEITPNGTRIEYWKNDHGGEDVRVIIPMIKSGSKAESFVKKQERE